MSSLRNWKDAYWERTEALQTEIAERKRMDGRLLLQNKILEGINKIFQKVITSESEEELGGVCLSVAEELTESKTGLIGEIRRLDCYRA